MPEVRPPIPDPTKREVRQRCGFGCVFCGLPLYEYHHMIPYSEAQEHKGANITLLCDRHHNEATNSLLTSEQISQADNKPYNLKHGVSTPYDLHFEGRSFDCVIGGNRFSTRLRDSQGAAAMIALSVDDNDLVWFRIDGSGCLFLNATIFDDKNLPLLVIRDNELAFRTATWDIEFQARTLSVREAPRKILFEIEFIPPREVVITRARLLCNGVETLVRTSHLFVANSQTVLMGCSASDCDVGLQLGRNHRGLCAGFSIDPAVLSRYPTPDAEVRRRERQALIGMRLMLERLGVSLDPESPI
jgi:trigger factor